MAHMVRVFTQLNSRNLRSFMLTRCLGTESASAIPQPRNPAISSGSHASSPLVKPNSSGTPENAPHAAIHSSLMTVEGEGGPELKQEAESQLAYGVCSTSNPCSASAASDETHIRQGEERNIILRETPPGGLKYDSSLQRCETCNLVLIDHSCPQGHVQCPSAKVNKWLFDNQKHSCGWPSEAPKLSRNTNAVDPSEAPTDTTHPDFDKDREVVTESLGHRSSVDTSSDSFQSIDVPIESQAIYDLRDHIWRCKICPWETEADASNDRHGFCRQGHKIEVFKIPNWTPADLCSADEASVDGPLDSDDEDAIDDSEVKSLGNGDEGWSGDDSELSGL